jgi:deoxyribodipyrimidine photo-lyase
MPKKHASVLHVYVFDPLHFGKADFSKSLVETGLPKCGGFRAQFLCESVSDLRNRIEQASAARSTLVVRSGRPSEVIADLAVRVGASACYFHSAESVEERRAEKEVSAALKAAGIAPKPVHGNTMFSLHDLPFDSSPNGKFPKTFSHFRSLVEKSCRVRAPLKAPAFLPAPMATPTVNGTAGATPEVSGPAPPAPPAPVAPGAIPTAAELLAAGGFDPQNAPNAHRLLAPRARDERATVQFEGGETAGLARLKEYFWDKDLLKSYKKTRNGMVGGDYSSKFSPWLAHGCLSPRFIFSEIGRYERERVKNKDTYWLFFELCWRDYFRYYCAHHGSSVFHWTGPKGRAMTAEQRRWARKEAAGAASSSGQPAKSWGQDLEKFSLWCAGRTGNAMIDANMRELAHTGFMSNRGRQIVASYLTRDMGLDWRLGAMWFEAALVDHDVCQNWGNWTYAAGVGSDPREDRYFNVQKQTASYDPQHKFISLWCPELASLPATQVRARCGHGCRGKFSGGGKFGGPKKSRGGDRGKGGGGRFRGRGGRRGSQGGGGNGGANGNRKRSKGKRARVQSSMYSFVKVGA